ncbi:hypothetical protein Cob_v009484 [Colletotrichum orbiculare MAFF 240422]|uniref:Uncharacterized protein n=1 Tax=Colletotrichum orbiculare (strain 104-T / ATCC 96160 / CBS 514.97 / LARS 414 / MAFF 240422) TaxID=1213857 RepID=A0A484FIN6_COLOR|nr:hypothetical protein Cob_v009484 [Colletotrichum orbiculare MAFF 240422]
MVATGAPLDTTAKADRRYTDLPARRGGITLPRSDESFCEGIVRFGMMGKRLHIDSTDKKTKQAQSFLCTSITGFAKTGALPITRA